MKESFKIKQILPDTFYEDVKLKEAICVKVEKKKTKDVIDLLKELKLNNEKVYLKSESFLQSETETEYSFLFGKNRNNKNNYDIYDISFLKRVKPLDQFHNRILVNFLDVRPNI